VSEEAWLQTAVATSTPGTITVRGRDLAGELMGRVSFSDVAFLLASGRLPAAGEARLFDAVLVSLAEHGLTPTVLAARLTYTGAPESIQGAIASGLLGGGTVFLGVVEDAARFLGDALARKLTATQVVEEALAGSRRIPGLGHPVHRQEDPRTPRLYALAEETGLLGPHLGLLEEVAEAQRLATGKELPINGAGAAGAALADLGFPAALLRGFALLARTAGLVGHLAEEMQRPLGMPLYQEVDRRAVYLPPP
jgi:citrate synthase